ncbi:MAG: hypothetical protein KatS3mg076_0760 [Candidatus Binatia bacterium]|nr:MAG: hypothetical protein KatS3mg076_0760 [Candidatus Binatia bacterium]
MTKAPLRIAVFLCMFVSVAGLGFVLARVWKQQHEEGQPGSFDFRPEVSQRIEEFHRLQWKDGRRQWEVEAKEARYFDREGRVDVVEPSVIVYLENGGSVSIRGREARVFLDEKELHGATVSGDVEVRIPGCELYARDARYDRGRGVVVAVGGVEFRAPEFRADAKRVELNLETRRLRFRDGVRTVLGPDGGAAHVP